MLIGVIVKTFLQKRRCQLIFKSRLEHSINSGKLIVLLNWLKSLTWKYSQTATIPGQCLP